MAVITALPGSEVLKDPSARMLPAGIIKEAWLRDATLVFEELNETGMSVIALDGSPASSTTSTLTVPEPAPGRKVAGLVNTSNFDGYPLGVTVVICEGGGDVSPCDCAVIIAVPGVVVVVMLTTMYSWPAGITTESGTEAMLVWEEARNTVRLLRVSVGRVFASSTETTSAG